MPKFDRVLVKTNHVDMHAGSRCTYRIQELYKCHNGVVPSATYMDSIRICEEKVRYVYPRCLLGRF